MATVVERVVRMVVVALVATVARDVESTTVDTVRVTGRVGFLAWWRTFPVVAFTSW